MAHRQYVVDVWGTDLMRLGAASVAAAWLIGAGALAAQDLAVQAKASFVFNGERVKISRNNDDAPRYIAAFASNSDACGAHCIAPMTVAEGVETFGEAEVLAYLMEEVSASAGLLVDARLPEQRAVGFIPGSVSLPHQTLEPNNSFRTEILVALGAREFDGVFNFANARSLLVYDRGPSSDDATQLVQNLINAGFPTDKIKYYRGGMQAWAMLGFSIEDAGS